MSYERASQHVFFGVSALIFAASAAATDIGFAFMSEMGGMSMPCGWTKVMKGMLMPGRSGAGAEAKAVSPSRAGIRRQHTVAGRGLAAAGKVMCLPRGELERTGDQHGRADCDRNGAR